MRYCLRLSSRPSRCAAVCAPMQMTMPLQAPAVSAAYCCPITSISRYSSAIPPWPLIYIPLLRPHGRVLTNQPLEWTCALIATQPLLVAPPPSSLQYSYLLRIHYCTDSASHRVTAPTGSKTTLRGCACSWLLLPLQSQPRAPLCAD